MYGISLDITEELILSYVTEEQIFKKYLGVDVVYNELICSPLRKDSNPTCGFGVSKSGRIMFRDFRGDFFGGCIAVVMKKHRLSYRDALVRIYKEMILNEDLEQTFTPTISVPKTKKVFKVKRRKLDNYYTEFGISESTTNLFKVTGLQTLWIDDKIVYSYNDFDPGYLYDFGNEEYKAYFPYRESYRFLTNSGYIQGYDQLPKKGDLLIITKSLKDVMVLYELGYIAVAPQSESTLIGEPIMVDLKRRFKKIVSLMDFDYAGVSMMNKLKRYYKIRPYTLTNGRFYTENFNAKDISDYRKRFGEERTRDLLQRYD